MNFLKKLQTIGNFGKKLFDSHGFSVAKKIISHPDRYVKKAYQFVKDGGLKDPNTYLKVSEGLDKFNKNTVSKMRETYADEAYGDNPFDYLSKGLTIGSDVFGSIGKGIQRGKGKSKLEKAKNVARTASDVLQNFM